MAGGEGDSPESAATGALISWDFVASAWVAMGKQLKPDDVSPEEAAALGVDAAAWRAFTYAEKKDLA